MPGRSYHGFMKIQIGEQIEERPPGEWVVQSIGTGVDGWSYTFLKDAEANTWLVKKSRLRLGRTPCYEAEYYWGVDESGEVV
jgi:hypothetical protein